MAAPSLSACNPTLRRVNSATSTFAITGSGFDEASTIELKTDGVDFWECTNVGVNGAGTELTVDALCYCGEAAADLAYGPAWLKVSNDADSAEGEFAAQFIDS